MKISKYVCPETLAPLYEVVDENTGQAESLRTKDNREYIKKNGFLDLTFPPVLDTADARARNFYEGRAEDYDKYLHLTFKTHGEDETTTRNFFVDLLEIQPGNRVLDLACGTGRDSELISQRLGDSGEIFCVDISPDMLRCCVKRLESFAISKNFASVNAIHLPFEDNFFDALFSFGGLGEFSDIRKSLNEMVRVTKVGGRIVVGDESIPIWLRDTEFSKILTTTNAQFKAHVPLGDIPIEARNFCLRYVIGGVFYLIDFTVGEGEPSGNFDFEIPGIRGGTYRTRYEGQLEGVTKETKELAVQAVKKQKTSMHKWLDRIVRENAEKILKKE